MSESCRRCGAPITWAITEKGRRMPLDRDPVPDGNVVITELAGVRSPGGMIPRVHVLHKDENPPGQRYKAHFATCPSRPKRGRR